MTLDEMGREEIFALGSGFLNVPNWRRLCKGEETRARDGTLRRCAAEGGYRVIIALAQPLPVLRSPGYSPAERVPVPAWLNDDSRWLRMGDPTGLCAPAFAVKPNCP
jgi:hypothetical protein